MKTAAALAALAAHPEMRPRSKLQEFDVMKIRQRHADGDTVSAIAREFSVDRKHIRRIVRREAWAHLG